MALYFFHLHEAGVVVEDLEGQDLETVDLAIELAVKSARDVMMGELRAGRLRLDNHIQVTDAASNEITQIAFRDVVDISGCQPCET